MHHQCVCVRLTHIKRMAALHLPGFASSLCAGAICLWIHMLPVRGTRVGLCASPVTGCLDAHACVPFLPLPADFGGVFPKLLKYVMYTHTPTNPKMPRTAMMMGPAKEGTSPSSPCRLPSSPIDPKSFFAGVPATTVTVPFASTVTVGSSDAAARVEVLVLCPGFTAVVDAVGSSMPAEIECLETLAAFNSAWHAR